MFSSLVTPDLAQLNTAFRDKGHKLWFVGGCVRDCLEGIASADIDLGTDASPEEQAQIYEDAGFKYIPTGLHHGTFTVCLAADYEVTSFRDRNGEYTRDIEKDLSQRDFTINAQAVDFEGTHVDPFGGAEHLKARQIVFVGDMNERLEEDPLRMLRWFRFQARFGLLAKPDPQMYHPNHLHNLKECVKVGRVWNEISKSLQTDFADWIMDRLVRTKIHDAIRMPEGRRYNLLTEVMPRTQDPILRMIAYQNNPKSLNALASAWKWTSQERSRAQVIASTIAGPMTINAIKARATSHGEPLEWLMEAAQLLGADDVLESLRGWVIPKFPLTPIEVGDDQEFAKLKMEWAYSGFRLSEKVLRKRLIKVA